MRRHDALVIGAGPAGGATAILLARAGWDVAIVEKAAFPRRKVCGEYLSPGCWPLLDELGVAAALLAKAGPSIRRVGYLSGRTALDAAMPAAADSRFPWGRALGREHLDTHLLKVAAQAGARVIEQTAVTGTSKDGSVFTSHLRGRTAEAIEGRIVIAAHGAWECGALPTQPVHHARPDDLLGFKAHFRGARHPVDSMPLVVFHGGYGGLVATDDDRASFSCCIRRETLEAVRRERGNLRAGEAVLEHILAECHGLREALGDARLEGPWLAAGPVRPGVHGFRRGGLFAVGNAAGEAHPLIAEGISMAIQSAFLLARALTTTSDLEAAHRVYADGWRRNFAPRLHAAQLFARVTMSPVTGPLAARLLHRLPVLLTLGARWSGKSQPFREIVHDHA